MMGTFSEYISTITRVAAAYSIAEILMVTMAARWIMGLMFLATLPMALLLPGRKKTAQQQKAMTAD